MIYMLNIGLGVASALFVAAYILARKKIQPLHQYLAASATIITVVIGLALIVIVRFVNAGSLPESGVVPHDWAHIAYIIIHRIIASIAFVMMLMMAYLGARRRIELHKRLALPFLILYLVVYLSGLLLFKGV